MSAPETVSAAIAPLQTSGLLVDRVRFNPKPIVIDTEAETEHEKLSVPVTT